jgi:hypothetical protein
MTKPEAISWIRRIQNGDGVDRTIFPESMKGSIAVSVWDQAEFTYGVEYGVIIGLMLAFDINEHDLRQASQS